jgi:hypothetical protein
MSSQSFLGLTSYGIASSVSRKEISFERLRDFIFGLRKGFEDHKEEKIVNIKSNTENKNINTPVSNNLSTLYK